MTSPIRRLLNRIRQRRTAAHLETILYTRDGCHLCDQAHDLLLRHGFQPQLVDIDTDPSLSSEYGETIPVVWIDGKLRFRGQVNETLLLRLLRS